MPIARKPVSKPDGGQDVAADRFISGASLPAPVASQPPQPAPDDGHRQPTMIRFDRALLARVDKAAKRRGISRSAWVQYTLSKALDDDEAG
jgi:molybdopterin-guanine dinucleotide biosynthesis protein A